MSNNKPEFRILEKDGKYAVEYLSITTEFIFFKKKEWKPFIHSLQNEDEIIWCSSLDTLKNWMLFEVFPKHIYK
jgi:hypothetical protein